MFNHNSENNIYIDDLEMLVHSSIKTYIQGNNF